jgi:hypothetical protein
MTNPFVPATPLLPAPVPAKPDPVDVALVALSEVATELLAGDRPSRFAELRQVMGVAMQVQRLRSAATVSVEDMGMVDDDEGMGVIRHHRNPRWNDAADLNTQVIMLAQKFLEQYAEAEKKKASRPDPDVRLNEVTELAELFELRLKLALADHPVPDEITYRINQLLKRIGESAPTEETSHEPETANDDASSQQQR